MNKDKLDKDVDETKWQHIVSTKENAEKWLQDCGFGGMGFVK